MSASIWCVRAGHSPTASTQSTTSMQKKMLSPIVGGYGAVSSSSHGVGDAASDLTRQRGRSNLPLLCQRCRSLRGHLAAKSVEKERLAETHASPDLRHAIDQLVALAMVELNNWVSETYCQIVKRSFPEHQFRVSISICVVSSTLSLV